MQNFSATLGKMISSVWRNRGLIHQKHPLKPSNYEDVEQYRDRQKFPRFELNIPAGEYFLYLGLADISGERIELDQRWPVRRLTVVSDRSVIGFSFSPAYIELRKV